MRKLSVSLPEELVVRIDRERGLVPRSAWIARLLDGGVKAPTRLQAPESQAPAGSRESSAAVEVEPVGSPPSRSEMFLRATQRRS